MDLVCVDAEDRFRFPEVRLLMASLAGVGNVETWKERQRQFNELPRKYGQLTPLS